MRPLAIIATHPIQYQAPLYQYLAEHGFAIQVLFLSDHGLQSRYDIHFGKVIQWDVPLLEGYPNKLLRNLRRDSRPDRFLGLVNPGVVTRLLTDHFSAVLVHGHRNLSMVLAGLSAHMRRLPLLYRSERFQPPSTKLRRVGGPAFSSAVAACLSIGSLNDQFYESLGVSDERRFLVPYAVDNERFRQAASSLSKIEARKKLQIVSNGPVVLFAGKLVPWKQPDMLLRAFANLPREDIHLVLAGEGSMRKQLQSWAETHLPGRVTFLGFLNQTEMPMAYRSADLLVLPSSSEPWGLVVNEVMNFGVPVVVSDRVGCGPDLVIPGETGAVFAADDQSSLTCVLTEMLHDFGRMTLMGAAARSHIAGWGFAQAASGLACALESVGAR